MRKRTAADNLRARVQLFITTGQMEPSDPGVAENADSEMAERIAWLRDRGVEVAIPGETSIPEPTRTGARITVVRIPCDDSLPIEAVPVTLSAGAGGDQLKRLLCPFFSGPVDNLDEDALNAAAAAQFGTVDVKVSRRAIAAASAQGSVEAFPLDPPCEANGQVGVFAYVDEAGALKGLQTNRRAAGIANLCGFENVPFKGDVFIGRAATVHSAGGPGNRGMDLQEIRDSSAAWLRGVQARNYAAGVAKGSVSMDSGAADELTNGGVDKERKYRWSETTEGVDIVLSLPPGTTSKQIVVSFKAKALGVGLKAAGPGSLLLALSLAGPVQVDDCAWTLAEGELEMTLAKSRSGMWGRLGEAV